MPTATRRADLAAAIQTTTAHGQARLVVPGIVARMEIEATDRGYRIVRHDAAGCRVVRRARLLNTDSPELAMTAAREQFIAYLLTIGA